MRLLTLWWKYGSLKEIEQALEDGFKAVNIDTWLDVIPQIIARIHAPIASVRRLIQELLTEIGKAHPQALVYPLTMASKSSTSSRVSAAKIGCGKIGKIFSSTCGTSTNRFQRTYSSFNPLARNVA